MWTLADEISVYELGHACKHVRDISATRRRSTMPQRRKNHGTRQPKNYDVICGLGRRDRSIDPDRNFGQSHGGSRETPSVCGENNLDGVISTTVASIDRSASERHARLATAGMAPENGRLGAARH